MFMFQCLTRTQEKKKRKFPPSSKEIECVTMRKPIIEKVHFLNGSHRVVEFDAAATCVEVELNFFFKFLKLLLNFFTLTTVSSEMFERILFS